MTDETLKTNVLIVGTGIAGLTSAYFLGKAGVDTIVITKEKNPLESNTYYAQGGIVTLGIDDSPEILVKDILSAGNHISNPSAVHQLADIGTRLVKEFLIDEVGVPFTTDSNGNLLYTREGNHSRRRIVFSKDETGKAIEETLFEKVKKLESVRILSEHTAIDLLSIPHHSKNPLRIYDDDFVTGAYVLDQKTGIVKRIFSDFVILATGGLGRIYLHTTNPPSSRGDGFAIAYRAGAKLINMEYIQFHPTSLFHRDADGFLITEALRGEGAILKNRKGEAFMKKYCELGDLAPRDIVARAIYEEMIKNGDSYVLLDLSELKVDPQERFPHIYETCKRYGIDIKKEPIPVVPAAHYSCGGVKVNLNGESTVKNLYAVGEVSCTGVHGANRLASTSLLEGLTWGYTSAKDIEKKLPVFKDFVYDEIPEWKYPEPSLEVDPALITQDWFSIKSTMWNYAGIIRTERRLLRAKADLEYLKHRIEKFYRGAKVEDSIIGLRNGIQTALIVVNSALKNKVSRGTHYRAS